MWFGYIKDRHIIKGQFLPFIEKHATTYLCTNTHLPLHYGEQWDSLSVW